jgi:ATP-binding cassette subfamily B protein
MVPLMGIMASAGTLVVVGLGGAEVIAGRISLGDFVAFSAYLAYLVWPTLAFGWLLNTFQRGAAALRRIAEILAHPVEQRDLPAGHEARLEGAITYRNLTFAHPGAAAGSHQLAAIDLEIPAGSSLGILGTVGSGKTTLTSFLPRIIPPPAGTVLIDGVDVNDIPLGRLRRDVALVPQEPFLFSRTLRENLTLADTHSDPQRVAEAARASRLANDLPQLPDGLDTIVGERGVTLSGGQRQRATIARALLADPRVLVLDDAFSSLDAEVERDVVEEIRRRSAGLTTIVISNRVASLSWADNIIVMDGGRIVERGRHADLLAGEGLYARIARRQTLADRLEAT